MFIYNAFREIKRSGSLRARTTAMKADEHASSPQTCAHATEARPPGDRRFMLDEILQTKRRPKAASSRHRAQGRIRLSFQSCQSAFIALIALRLFKLHVLFCPRLQQEHASRLRQSRSISQEKSCPGEIAVLQELQDPWKALSLFISHLSSPISWSF